MRMFFNDLKNICLKKISQRLHISCLMIGLFCSSATFADASSDWFLAVKNDHLPTITSMLLKGADPNIIEPTRGDHALIVALQENSFKVFDFLVGLSNIHLNWRNQVGNSALMIAAYKKNIDAVQKLIDKGAEVNQTGWTALHYAAAAGSNPIVQLLLDNDAYIDTQSPNKTTPLMMAARGGYILTVKLLLDEGADLTLKNSLGMTALDMAIQHHHQDIMDGLRYRLSQLDQEKNVDAPKPSIELPQIETPKAIMPIDISSDTTSEDAAISMPESDAEFSNTETDNGSQLEFERELNTEPALKIQSIGNSS